MMKTMNIKIGEVLAKHVGEQFTTNELCEWMYETGVEMTQGSARGYLKRFKDGGLVTALGMVRRGSYAWSLFTINQSGVEAMHEFNEKEKAKSLIRRKAGALKRTGVPRKKITGTVWSKHALMSGKPGTTSIMMGPE